MTLLQYFEHVEEAVWAVEVLKTTGKPVAASLCIGPKGDMHGVSPGECAVRLVKAGGCQMPGMSLKDCASHSLNSAYSPSGAQIVGVNCHFDPMTCVETVKLMKEGVEKAGLKAHYMVQPLAFHTPDCNCQGFIDLPEFPFGKFDSLDAGASVSCDAPLHVCAKGECLKVAPALRSGAQDPDPLGHAQVRQGGLQRRDPIHRRLLWI